MVGNWMCYLKNACSMICKRGDVTAMLSFQVHVAARCRTRRCSILSVSIVCAEKFSGPPKIVSNIIGVYLSKSGKGEIVREFDCQFRSRCYPIIYPFYILTKYFPAHIVHPILSCANGLLT